MIMKSRPWESSKSPRKPTVPLSLSGCRGTVGLFEFPRDDCCFCRSALVRSALDLALDERLDRVAGLVVEVLHGRALHEVGRRELMFLRRMTRSGAHSGEPSADWEKAWENFP